MQRHFPALAALAFAAALSGCSMCQSPFDYCAPVSGPDGCPNCNFGARRGSIFAPMDDSVASTPMGPTRVEMLPVQPADPKPARSPESATSEPGTGEDEAVDTLVR